MNYNEAHDFIFYEIGDEGYKLLRYIAEDKMQKAIDLIIKLTNCELNDAKAIWADLKKDYGTKETNPFMDTSCNLAPKEIARNNQIAQDWSNKVHCPYCNSTNVKKISGFAKVGSVAMFGIFSQKVKKQWHCNNCKSDF